MIFRFPHNYIGITATFHSSSYENRFGKVHNGVDLVWRKKTGSGQPVYAVADGTVVYLVDNDKSGKSWGNCVKLKHDSTTYTMYAHLRDGVQVKYGQSVKQGDLLGYTGATGFVTGEHLHYEVYKGGSATKYRVDPLLYTYVFPDQEVHPEDVSKVKYYTPEVNPEPSEEFPKYHTVVSGDTLSGIALKYYGNGDKDHYMFIAETNGIDNPNLINVGQVLKILEYKVAPAPQPIIEFKVGDKVKVDGGRAYATPDGTGNQTAVYEGETRYITKITDLSKKCPYHISVGETLGDRDRGWIEGKYLTKI